MALTKMQKTIGLDIGSFSVKAVELQLDKKKQFSIVSTKVLNTQTEGILSDKEMQITIGQWIKDNHWTKSTISAGLPQDLATTQISDFPPSVGNNLEEMVGYETSQLAGISDERFIHDFQPMEAKFGRTNPVLIGICRESLVREKSNELKKSHINISELSMNGIAVANAFFHLHPELLSIDTPQMLLDIGYEISTILIIAEGQLIHIGTIPFGSQQYTEAISQQMEISQEAAEQQKYNTSLNFKDTESPIFIVSQQFEYELHNAIEQWREQERNELNDKMISHIWLSGGGAKLQGLEKFLSNALGCPTQIFGPTSQESGEISPELVTAYGLALEPLNLSKINISLCPAEIKWEQIRRKRFPYLIISAAIIYVTVLGLMFNYYQNLLTKQKNYKKELSNLRKCNNIIPQLEEAISKTWHYETTLIPFIERGNNSVQFLSLINDLSKVKTKDDWFIYIGDEPSYYKYMKKDNKKDITSAFAIPIEDKATGLSGFGSTSTSPQKKSAVETDQEFQNKIIVTEMPLNQNYIVVGYTANKDGKAYDAIESICNKLNQCKINKTTNNYDDDKLPAKYHNVDIVKAKITEKRSDIEEPWNEVIKKKPFNTVKPFTLIIPFANPSIIIPKSENKKNKKNS